MENDDSGGGEDPPPDPLTICADGGCDSSMPDLPPDTPDTPTSPCEDALALAHRPDSAVSAAMGNWDTIAAAGQAYGVDPRYMAAIGVYESNFTLGLIGDKGHGHGVYQFDDRYNSPSVIQLADSELTNDNFAATTDILAGKLDDSITHYENLG
jgi:hypothetical protein